MGGCYLRSRERAEGLGRTADALGGEEEDGADHRAEDAAGTVDGSPGGKEKNELMKIFQNS